MVASGEAAEGKVERALRADLPELGLSNKARVAGDSVTTMSGLGFEKEESKVESMSSGNLSAPPTDDVLVRNTLWPEVEKLYGHGYEIIAMAANHSGSLLAASCFARTSTHAVIRLWRTSDWTEVLQFAGHTLTVVQLEFSPDDKFLVAVSRDRHVSVFSIVSSSPPTGGLIFRNKGHSRIVWSCSWAHDSSFFATGSRDRRVVVWRRVDKADGPSSFVKDSALPTFAKSVTAVALFPQHPQAKLGRHYMCVGMENGLIEIWCSSTERPAAESVEVGKSSSAAATPTRKVQPAGDGEAASDGEGQDDDVVNAAAELNESTRWFWSLFLQLPLA